MSTRFAIEAVFKGIDKFSAPVARMTTKMDRFTRRIRKGVAGVGKMTKRMARGFRNSALTLGSIAVIGGYALKGLIGPAAKFEASMAGVNAVTLGAIENMGALSKEARRLGRSTIYTATEVGDAMETMARAGLGGDEIMSGIEPILLAAAAEKGASIEQTAKVIIASMKGMGVEFSETKHVADVFALAASSAKTTIAELGEGLSKVAPVAKQFGMEFDDMVATVAVLQDVGIEASMSGTQLKTMLTKLAMLTPKAEARFKKLGITIQDASNNMLSMPQLIANISEGLSKARGNMAKVSAIATAVGLRGSTAANQLASAWQSGKLPELMEKLASSSKDAAKRMYQLRQNTLLGDITKLKSAWEGFRVDVATSSLGRLRELVQSLTETLTDPANIEAAAKWLDSATNSMKTWWEDNKSGIKEQLQVAMSVAKILAGVVGILWKMVGFLPRAANALDEGATSINDSTIGKAVNDIFGWDPDNQTKRPGLVTEVLGLPPSYTATEKGTNVTGDIWIRDPGNNVVGVSSSARGMSIRLDNTASGGFSTLESAPE